MRTYLLVIIISFIVLACSAGKQTNEYNMHNSPIYNSYEYDLCYNDRFTGYYEECEDADFDYEHDYYYY